MPIIVRGVIGAGTMAALTLSCHDNSVGETPACAAAPALAAEWMPAVFQEFGVSLHAPPQYAMRFGALETEGQTLAPVEIENNFQPPDTSPPWICGPGRAGGDCRESSEHCVMEVQGRRVYVEAAALYEDATAGLVTLSGTPYEYEFRPYAVMASWRVGPARWHSLNGSSRDAAGQREMLAALRSLRFDVP